MPAQLSRRKIAQHTARRIMNRETDAAITELAAYLVDTNRTREAALVVRDIEMELADNGIVIAKVTTAHPLTEQLRRQIIALMNAQTVYLDETVDQTVIGGVKIDMPGKEYDATVRAKLNKLKEMTLL